MNRCVSLKFSEKNALAYHREKFYYHKTSCYCPLGNPKPNEGESKSCLDQVFNFKLDSFAFKNVVPGFELTHLSRAEQWGGIICKHNARWHHVSRLKASAFYSFPKKLK